MRHLLQIKLYFPLITLGFISYSFYLPYKLKNSIHPKNNLKEAILTTKYNEFDSSKSYKENIHLGYVDTFRISGRLFRIKEDTINGDYIIQFKLNNIWQNNNKLMIRDDFQRIDINDDGNADVVSNFMGRSYNNYYLTNTQTFSRQYIMPGDADTMIDAVHKLYVNYQKSYRSCDDPTSQLYNYQNGVPVIQFIYEADRDCGYEIKRFVLFKCNTKNKLQQLIKKNILKHPIPNDDNGFNYIAFWKKNYKKLMGY